jgi:hypothetical protein
MQLVAAAANYESSVQDARAVKALFRCVYFIFSSEIANASHWRELSPHVQRVIPAVY